MKVHSRAPLRLGLAGGGTDVSPYSDVYGGQVLNATLDRYAYAEVEANSDNLLIFEGTDQGIVEVVDIGNISIETQMKLRLHQAVYLKLMDRYRAGGRPALCLRTYSDAPVGSGLGASSTLVVAMIKAITTFLGEDPSDYEIASLAYEIERIDCRLAGGKQDQFSAAFGGFNFMKFQAGQVEVEPMALQHEFIQELESSLLLFNTGISRESASIISQQSQAIASNNDSLAAMHNLREEAESMKACFENQDLDGIAECMRNGWLSKKRSADAVSNAIIDGIFSAAVTSGAQAGKISGAGGGGFMLFLVPLSKRASVVRALSEFDGTVSNCHFSNQGAQSWWIK